MANLVNAFHTALSRFKHRKKVRRFLEIGPGVKPLPDFETLNILRSKGVDYVADIAKGLPFPENTFDLIYASHILEHVPWYQSEYCFSEFYRVLRHDGCLEIWVPDAVRICKAFVEYEEHGINNIDEDGWYKFNPEKDPCKWAAGRLYTYGDGCGSTGHPNWHRALFSFRYLKNLFSSAGFVDVERMDPSCVRGDHHGWINLGVKGRKR